MSAWPAIRDTLSPFRGVKRFQVRKIVPVGQRRGSVGVAGERRDPGKPAHDDRCLALRPQHHQVAGFALVGRVHQDVDGADAQRVAAAVQGTMPTCQGSPAGWPSSAPGARQVARSPSRYRRSIAVFGAISAMKQPGSPEIAM